MFDRPGTCRVTPSGPGRSGRGRAYGGEAPRGSVDQGLELHAEVGGDRRADALVARHAEADADADLAVSLLDDVGLVAGRVHPGVHDALRGAEVAGAPGEV